MTFPSQQAAAVLAFLNDRGPVPGNWAKKHHVLSGLYRFALARAWVTVSPLPRSIPKQTLPAFVPHIYSHGELRRLLDAIPAAYTERSAIDGYVFRALLLRFYGAGLRWAKRLPFVWPDVDMDQACLDVREAKFFKHRLVPMEADLANVMRAYVRERDGVYTNTANAPFLCCRAGTALSQSAVRNAFRRLRVVAKVEREGGSGSPATPS